jgi:hypothetical protein
VFELPGILRGVLRQAEMLDMRRTAAREYLCQEPTIFFS